MATATSTNTKSSNQTASMAGVNPRALASVPMPAPTFVTEADEAVTAIGQVREVIENAIGQDLASVKKALLDVASTMARAVEKQKQQAAERLKQATIQATTHARAASVFGEAKGEQYARTGVPQQEVRAFEAAEARGFLRRLFGESNLEQLARALQQPEGKVMLDQFERARALIAQAEAKAAMP